MNKDTDSIMSLLHVDADTAMQVQAAMQIDFSECSTREFNREARFAYAVMNDTVETIDYKDDVA